MFFFTFMNYRLLVVLNYVLKLSPIAYYQFFLFLQEKKLSNTVCLTLGPYNFWNSIGASTNLDGTNLNEPENIQMYKAYKETITNC